MSCINSERTLRTRASVRDSLTSVDAQSMTSPDVVRWSLLRTHGTSLLLVGVDADDDVEAVCSVVSGCRCRRPRSPSTIKSPTSSVADTPSTRLAEVESAGPRSVTLVEVRAQWERPTRCCLRRLMWLLRRSVVTERFSRKSSFALLPAMVLRTRRTLTDGSEDTSKPALGPVAVGPSTSRRRTSWTTALSGSSRAVSVRKRTASRAQSRKPIVCSASSTAVRWPLRAVPLSSSRAEQSNILHVGYTASLMINNINHSLSINLKNTTSMTTALQYKLCLKPKDMSKLKSC